MKNRLLSKKPNVYREALCFLENLTFISEKSDFYRKNPTFIGKALRFLENLTFIREKSDFYRKNSTFIGEKLTFLLCFLMFCKNDFPICNSNTFLKTASG